MNTSLMETNSRTTAAAELRHQYTLWQILGIWLAGGIGAWGWFGLVFVQSLFNTVLGEEFLFRGVLLPKMEGAFGKWDWVANGVIFGFYHIHQPWGIPSSILTGLIHAFSVKRFRTTWFSIILYSGQSIYLMFLILGLVLGLA